MYYYCYVCSVLCILFHCVVLRTVCVLYCTVLCCAVLYCTVLYCTVLYCAVLYCTVLYCAVLYCTVLYCIVMYCTVLYCIVLCCTVLYCTVLYCTVLYCTVLYCAVLLPPGVNPIAFNKYIKYIYGNISLHSSYNQKYLRFRENKKNVSYIHCHLSVHKIMWNKVVVPDRLHTHSQYVIILFSHHNNG